MQLSRSASALRGDYAELYFFNLNQKGYSKDVFSFVRWDAKQRLIVVSNFSDKNTAQFNLQLTPDLIRQWQLEPGQYQLSEKITQASFNPRLRVSDKDAGILITLKPLQSVVLELSEKLD